ncbi:MAG: sigma-70 family RNA polymerase sigma factor [Mycoplasma sp.]|nr:sigma-70 family RNA polymerase sigma factor [Mycoplasma sp.]
MNKKPEYENKTYLFYKNNKTYIYKLAKRIKNINLSIPLEIEDLISFSFYKLLESENKLEYFAIKTKNIEYDFNIFFKKKIWKYMWSYCNKYKTKNHQILNYVLVDDNNENQILNKSENYIYDELFNFLTSHEFFVIYNLIVNNLKRKEIAKKLNISQYKLRQIENEARIKLSKCLDIII